MGPGAAEADTKLFQSVARARLNRQVQGSDGDGGGDPSDVFSNMDAEVLAAVGEDWQALSALFQLTKSAVHDQSASPATYTRLLQAFVRFSAPPSPRNDPAAATPDDNSGVPLACGEMLWTSAHFQAQRTLIVRCLAELDAAEPQYFLEHGCVVLRARLPGDRVGLEVVGLDEHVMSPSYVLVGGGRRSVHTHSAATGRVDLPLEPVPLHRIGDIFDKAHELMAEGMNPAEAKNIDRKRNRTPAYVHAALSAALRGKEEIEPPLFNGTADVGLHTGIRSRETPWALVQALIARTLAVADGVGAHGGRRPQCAPGDTWLTVNTALCIALLAERCRAVQSSSPSVISTLMAMLTHCAELVATLPTLRAASRAFADDCAQELVRLRASIQAISSRQQERLAATQCLPSLSMLRASDMTTTFKIAPPRVPASRGTPTDGDLIERLADVNLGRRTVLLALAADTVRPSEVCKWFRTATKNAAGHTIAKATVEDVLWRMSAALATDTPLASLDSPAEMQSLTDLVQRYINLKIANDYHELDPRPLATHRSRVVLLKWTAYALIHQAVDRRFPNVRLSEIVRVPAAWRITFEHLVLPHQREREVLLRVAAYLHARSTDHEPELLFDSKASTNGVLAVADAFVNSRDILSNGRTAQAMWAQESEAAARRAAKHAGAVARKRANVQLLRRQLPALQRAERSREAEFQRKPSYQDYYEEEAWNSAKAALQEHKALINKKKAPPAPVYQSLSRNETTALRQLFCAFLPPEFGVLAQATQRTLRGLGSKVITRLATYTELQNYFNSNCANVGGATNLPHLSFDIGRHEAGTSEANDDKNDVTQFVEGDGIWHPDINPLCYGQHATKEWASCLRKHFTDTLPPGQAPGLQWTVDAPPSGQPDTVRGNQFAAELRQKPTWLDERQLTTLGALRAVPLLQLDKLRSVLAGDELPLDRFAVQSAIRHAVGGVGALSEDCTRLLWSDEYDREGLRVALLKALDGVCKARKDAPKHFETLVCLAHIAAFIASGDEDGSHDGTEVANQLAATAEQWADAQAKELQECESRQQFAVLPTLRAKCCLMLQSAILCFDGRRAPTPSDIATLIRLVVKARKFAPIVSEDTIGRQQVQDLPRLEGLIDATKQASLEVATAQLALHYPKVEDQALTKAVQSLKKETPDDLTWTMLAPLTLAYRAQAGDCTYHIHTQTGEVLFNGLPPSRLPASITDKPLFKRTFGLRNFDVLPETGNAGFRTANPLKMRPSTGLPSSAATRGAVEVNFTFALVDGQLLITEEEIAPNETVLELLPSLSPAVHADHLGAIPPRLHRLHSHWRCTKSGAIAFRGPLFSDRKTAFLAARHPDQAGELGIRRVPPHLQDECWQDLLPAARQPNEFALLCRLPSADGDHAMKRAASVLSKFEATDCMHWFLALPPPPPADGRPAAPSAPPDAVLSLELPRYGLVFEMSLGDRAQGKALRSVEYRGYALRAEQALPDALHGFSRYLVLQRVAEATTGGGGVEPELCMLVPDGHVTRGPNQSEVPVNVVPTPPASAFRPVTPTTTGEPPPGATLHLHLYRVHNRLGHLMAGDVAARLHLACLYVMCNTGLPEPRTGLTGKEQAVDLLRRCRQYDPFTAAEGAKLTAVFAAAQSQAEVRLLCFALKQQSRSLEFLHVDPASPPNDSKDEEEGEEGEEEGGSGGALRRISFCEPSAALYHSRRGGLLRNHRVALSATEVAAALGRPPAPAFVGYRASPVDGDGPAVSVSLEGLRAIVANFPVDVPAWEAGLIRELLEPDPTLADGIGKLTGLSKEQGCRSKLGQHHLQECEDSWAELGKLKPQRLKAAVIRRGLLETARRLRAQARPALESYEREILSVLNWSRPTDGIPAAFWAHKACGAVAAAARVDLLHIAAQEADASHLLAFNPFLSGADCEFLVEQTLAWMQACVFDDRLQRIEALASALSDGPQPTVALADGKRAASPDDDVRAKLALEIATRRVWGTAGRGYWLVFEVEGQLQIRPKQFFVAEKLIDGITSGTVLQLNMGEGKTRVILPMLMLYFALTRADLLLRGFFLHQLLDACTAHFKRHLTASVLYHPLLRLAFHRGVELNAHRVRCLADFLAEAHRAGGSVVMTPSTALSLQLKVHELRLGGVGEDGEPTRDGELATLLERRVLQGEGLPCRYVNVYDECDAILRHNYQLVYAAGETVKLPNRKERLAALQGVLRILGQRSLFDRLGLKEGEYSWEERGDRRGSFPVLAFADKSALRGVGPALVDALLDAPAVGPLQLLGNCIRGTQQDDDIKEVLLNAQAEAGRGTAPFEGLSEEFVNILLVLRGLLGHGKLASVMQKRAGVNFGLDRRRNKRIAVPFRANDTPTERSEFADVDCSLCYTHLAYYQAGLQREELKACFVHLGGLPTAQQETHFAQWYKRSLGGMDEDSVAWGIKDAENLDPADPVQFDAIYDDYAYNTEVINFFLDHIVTAQDMNQFQHRLRATPWNIADQELQCGFSGTNDANVMLPLQVRAEGVAEGVAEEGAGGAELPGREETLRELRATNGYMLHCIKTHSAQKVVVLEDAEVWAQVLDLAVEGSDRGSGDAGQYDAIIDVGALLAGTTTKQCAQHLLSRQTGVVRAVVYSSTTGPTLRQQWRVRDWQRRDVLLSSSPIRECDAITLFDQNQCRGADLKLRQRARALLTIGPDLCKDDLMQAAGRLRQLGRGQTLVFCLTQAVQRSIQRLCGLQPSAELCPQHILQYVLANTTESSHRALAMSTTQGVHFLETKRRPDLIKAPEKLEPEELYGAARKPQTTEDVLRSAKEDFAQRAAAAGDVIRPDLAAGRRDALDALEAQLEARINKLGTGSADASLGDTAQEEECERELQREVEKEREHEEEYAAVQAAIEKGVDMQWILTKTSPKGRLGCKPFGDVPKLALDGTSNIFLSDNFLHPLHSRSETLLPLARAYLTWPASGHSLVLAENEANTARDVLRKAGGSLVNKPHVQLHMLPLGSQSRVAEGADPLTLVALMMLNSETNFWALGADDETKAALTAALRKMLSTPAAKALGKAMPGLRNREQNLDLSQLSQFV